jgi:integrase
VSKIARIPTASLPSQPVANLMAMATVRERSPGVFAFPVFVGRDDRDRPVQSSRTFRGTRRQAERFAASLSLRAPSRAAGPTVADALEAWLEVNLATWAPSTARDYLSRAKAIGEDSLGAIPLARLSVQDVEQWHAKLRRRGVGEGGIRNRHIVLRAALSQAEVWSWLTINPARLARLRRPKSQARGVLTPSEVLEVLDAAYRLDPRAGVALRLAAVAGLRRAELAALRYADLRGRELLVDSAIAIVRQGNRLEPGPPELRDDPTKGSRRD